MHKIFTLVLSLPLIFSYQNKTRVSKKAIVSFVITPFIIGSESYISVDTLGSTTSLYNVSIKLINDSYPDGVVLSDESFLGAQNYKITYDNRYTEPSGNKIEITYGKIDGTLKTISHDVNVAVKTNKTYDEDGYLLSNEPVLTFNNVLGWKETFEELEFCGFNDTYIPDFYHKFDPADLKVKVNSKYDDLILGDATFLITNINGVFDKLNSNSTYATIKMGVVKNENDEFEFCFKDNLYVNPETLEMSNRHYKNYVKTKYLYFPRNEMRYQNNYTCIVAINEIGINRFKLNYRFTLNALINLLGDCHNSEYCVVVS